MNNASNEQLIKDLDKSRKELVSRLEAVAKKITELQGIGQQLQGAIAQVDQTVMMVKAIELGAKVAVELPAVAEV